MKLIFKQYKYINSYACIIVTTDHIRRPIEYKIQSGTSHDHFYFWTENDKIMNHMCNIFCTPVQYKDMMNDFVKKEVWY